MDKSIPAELQQFRSALGEYDVIEWDLECGEPLAWGWPIIARLSEDQFNELHTMAPLICITFRQWAVVDSTLTIEMAVEKYGPIVERERGPRGGFISVTFGEKKFVSRRFQNA